MISPIFAKDLSGLPPILIQAGQVERLNDECSSFCEKVASTNSRIQFEVYEDQPHVFHFFLYTRLAQVAMKRASRFLMDVTSGKSVENSKLLINAQVDVAKL